MLQGRRMNKKNRYYQDFIRVYQCHPWFLVFEVSAVVLERLLFTNPIVHAREPTIDRTSV